MSKNKGPYTQPSGGRKTVHDKFAELGHILSPKPVSSWACALKAIKRINETQHRKHHKIYNYYVFPDPGLFLSTEMDQCGIHYLKNWVNSREAWLYIANSPNHNPVALALQTWYDLLYHGFSTGERKAIPPKTLARIQEMVNGFGWSVGSDGDIQLDDCAPAVEDDDFEMDVPLVWNGEDLQWGDDEFATDGTVQKVLWELYELNFRSELLAMDFDLANAHYETPESSAEREDFMAKCFDGGDEPNFCWFRPYLSSANHGLTDPDVAHRHPFVVNLANVMRTWVVGFPSVLASIIHLGLTASHGEGDVRFGG
jgi:hypothetical protein